MNDVVAMKAEEQYKIAVNARQLEVQMFWQRSNYLLLINTAIAAAYVSQASDAYLALCGLGAAVLWFGVNLGGKYWQVRWEAAVSRLECLMSPNLKLFSASRDEVDQEVRAFIARSGHQGASVFLDRLILLRLSVTAIVILLSLGFVIAWLIALFLRVA